MKNANININEEKNTAEHREIKCLDKGFVRLVDYMGSDDSIVQAARVSYGKGTKSVREDKGLIRYLLRHRHTSPFEMVEFKFHIKLPIFVARQWIRHRTANVNEYSGRYSEMKDEFYLPELNDIRLQSKMNRQGRDETALPKEEASKIQEMLENSQNIAYNEYTHMLEQNVARELARINLPLSNYTEWYWKIDLHNLFHFLKLRLDEHSQYEIRVFASAIAEIVRDVVPVAFEAFEDYILFSRSFSSIELKILKILLNKQPIPTLEELQEFGLSIREAREFMEKLL